MLRNRDGLSLIEVVISVSLIAMLFGGIYMIYYAVQDVTANTQYREDAAGILSRQIELVRNLPYAQVGTVNGIPTGILLQKQTVTSTDGAVFTVTTTVRNIDDPFDGTLGGVPNDTAPADYKTVIFDIACKNCARFVPLSFTATVAPKNLESASTNGSLFITVLDANGVPVPSANVHVLNAITTPTIDFTDVTNQAGVLQLVGVPTSTQSYQVFVTKPSFSFDQTYAASSSNPNPLKPPATVAVQTVTQLSFGIDGTSNLTVRTQDPFCAAIPNQSIAITGSKLIGTSPDVPKFSVSTSTGASGQITFPNFEWDTYAFSYGGSSAILGFNPQLPLTVNPSSTINFAYTLVSQSPDSLLINVKDAATGAPVSNATVSLTGPGAFSTTKTTGHYTVGQSDWSGGQFTDSSGIDASTSGQIVMAGGAGAYSTTTVAWLESQTFDLGSPSSTLYSLAWTPVVQPAQTTLRFQIAANNDNATWQYVGPGGNPAAYFTNGVSGALNTLFPGDRYVRYKAFFSTQDETQTPIVTSATLEFSGPCLPPGQTFLRGLAAGTYDASVSAGGYAVSTSSITVSSSSVEADILMAP